MERQSKRTKMTLYTRALNESITVTGRVAGFVGLAMAILVTSEVFMRYFLNAPSKWIQEVTTYLLVVLFCLGIAYTQRVGGHIRVDILFRRLPEAVRAWVDLIELALFFVFAVILLYFTGTNFLMSWKLASTSRTIMQFPLAPWQVFLPLGFALLALILIRTIYVKVIEMGRRKIE